MSQKYEMFDNKRVLEAYPQDDVSVLREACRTMSSEFIKRGNIDVFLESVIIASACKKVMCKRFLKPNTMGLILSGGYSGNANYSNKTTMWLLF